MATNNQVNVGLSGSTGTGNFVGSNTPTLITPVLGAATATSINKLLITAPATSSTLAIADGKTLTVSNTLTLTGTDSSSVAFGAGGTVIYSGGSPTFAAITFSPTTGGIVGTTTNDNAAAGKVGEVISSVILVSGSPVSLTTATPANITSISLTAGDWDIWGNVGYVIQSGVSVVQATLGWISATSASVPDAALFVELPFNSTTALTSGFGYNVPHVRASLAGTTTYYLSVDAVFSAGTLSGVGQIFARRSR